MKMYLFVWRVMFKNTKRWKKSFKLVIYYLNMISEYEKFLWFSQKKYGEGYGCWNLKFIIIWEWREFVIKVINFTSNMKSLFWIIILYPWAAIGLKKFIRKSKDVSNNDKESLKTLQRTMWWKFLKFFKL